MSDKDLVLYVASYPDASAAQEDLEALRLLRDADDVKILASDVATRGADGKLKDSEHDPSAGRHAVGWGAAAGVLVGLFAPPLLAATAIGAAAGGVLHELHKHHEEHEIAKDVDQYLPPDSSAIIAVFDNKYVDRVDKALSRATKKTDRALDSDNYRKLAKALDSGDDAVLRALDS